MLTSYVSKIVDVIVLRERLKRLKLLWQSKLCNLNREGDFVSQMRDIRYKKQNAQVINIFTIFPFIGRGYDGRRVGRSAAIDLQIDRSIAVSLFHRGMYSSTRTYQ